MNMFFNNHMKKKIAASQPDRQTERKKGKISQTRCMKKKSYSNVILNEYRNAGADTKRRRKKTQADKLRCKEKT